MPTGKSKSRYAWEAANLPAIRRLHPMCSVDATGNTKKQAWRDMFVREPFGLGCV